MIATRALLAAFLLFSGKGYAQYTVELGALKDNTLYEDEGGTLSNGIGPNFFVGRNNLAELRRGAIEFDVAGSLPPGVLVDSVRLDLYMSQSTSGPVNIDLHRLTDEWGEGTSSTTGGMGAPSTPGDATWIHAFYDSVFWMNPGGDYQTQVSASQSVDGVGPYSWGTTSEMVADIQLWLDDPSLNHGWIVIGDETVNQTAKRFETRENTVVLNRPLLTIWYSDSPAGIPCEEIDFFGAKCKGSGEIQAVARLLNSTRYAGTEVRFQIDSTEYPIELVTNGTHSIARLLLDDAGAGPHTVSLTIPTGCLNPVIVSCPANEGRQNEDEFDRVWNEGQDLEISPFMTQLHANYPNPFNPTTTIHYTLAVNSMVKLQVFNVLGQEIVTLVDGFEPAGIRTAVWNGVNSAGHQVPSGLYFYRLSTGTVSQTRSMILSK